MVYAARGFEEPLLFPFFIRICLVPMIGVYMRFTMLYSKKFHTRLSLWNLRLHTNSLPCPKPSSLIHCYSPILTFNKPLTSLTLSLTAQKAPHHPTLSTTLLLLYMPTYVYHPFIRSHP